MNNHWSASTQDANRCTTNGRHGVGVNNIAPLPESTAYRSPNLPIPRQRVRSIDYKCRTLGGELVEQWEGTGRNYEIDLDPTLDESGDEFNVGAKRTEWAVEVNENYAHQRSLVRSMWIVANDEAPPLGLSYQGVDQSFATTWA